MTIMRFISRSVLLKPSPSPTLRRFCTVAEESKPAETSTAAAQPSKKARLFSRVTRKAKSDESSVTDILNKWVSEGNAVKRFDITNLSNYFRSRRNYHAALQLYNWMESSSNYAINNADKAIHIDLLCKTRGLSAAENYFNTLQESEKTSKTYGALLCSYCREKIIDKALEIFDKMKASNYTSTLNYNTLLLLHYNTGNHEKVFSLVEEMEENNIPLNLYTYNVMINSYGARNKLDDIDGVLEKMKINNVEADMFTYGNLATIYTKSESYAKANTYLEMMEKSESRPGENAYEPCRTRIRLYSKMNDLPRVHRAWDTLKSAFPRPNNTSYLFMLSALSKMGDQENLEKIYNEWEEDCSTFDFRIPNVLFEYYLSRDMIEKATSLYKSLDGKGGKPNLRTMSLIASLNVKLGDIDSGLKYLEIGLDKAKTFNDKRFPTDDTIKLFQKYFEENHDPEKAERFDQVMKAISRVVDSDLVDADTEAPDEEISI